MKSPETLAQHPVPDFKAVLLWKLAVYSVAHARTARAFSWSALNRRKMVNRRASRVCLVSMALSLLWVRPGTSCEDVIRPGLFTFWSTWMFEFGRVFARLVDPLLLSEKQR
jgi:hypothetical protein